MEYLIARVPERLPPLHLINFMSKIRIFLIALKILGTWCARDESLNDESYLSSTYSFGFRFWEHSFEKPCSADADRPAVTVGVVSDKWGNFGAASQK